MSAHCHDAVCPSAAATDSPRYRRVLWLALAINAVMALVELTAGWRAGSVSLLADAVDFFGDAVNYGLSLAVLGLALRWRAGVALLKGLCMAAFGVLVLARAGWMLSAGTLPEALTMGGVGVLALIANLGVAGMLYAWRDGDANRRSVWLCSRNDAIGNLAVVAAALGVAGTGSPWPDLAVAALIALLALSSARTVIRQSVQELREGRAQPQA